MALPEPAGAFIRPLTSNHRRSRYGVQSTKYKVRMDPETCRGALALEVAL